MNLGPLYWKESHGGSIFVSLNTVSFVPALLWADINGLNPIYHHFSDGGWGCSHTLWRRHPEKTKRSISRLYKSNKKLQRVKLISLLIKTNVNGCKSCPVHDVLNILLWDSKIYVWPLWACMLYDDLERAETDVLCSCFVSNCSSFICCVFTEEPWQRQFTVTCRETDIKFLLILFLIIPTWNIWNKTAM